MPASVVRSLVLLLALLAGQSMAAGKVRVNNVSAVPQLDSRGQAGYREFLAATPPRSFAIAPGGAWGWSNEAGMHPLVDQEALANCQSNTRQRCRIYARDQEVVLGEADWARSWAPYPDKAEATRRPVGIHPGERFPDLAFTDARGRPVRLSDLRGKVVVLHFWGSWCPPCQREMPELARLASKTGRDIRFVLLQVREDFATARAWASRFRSLLPLYDSGMKSSGDTSFRLANGSQLADRSVAMAFPTSYVLDSHGIVLFDHVGPVTGWDRLLPLLRDAARHSGR